MLPSRFERPTLEARAGIMRSQDKEKTPEREQTDESLRVEREKADQDLAQRLTAIDEAADAVIEKARARADRLLARARARMDRTTPAESAREANALANERFREDRAVRQERASADDVVHVERSDLISGTSVERQETDKDLSRERARSDEAVEMRDAFLGIVSHDLRNMLNGMIGFAALIAEGVSEEQHGQRVAMYAQRIQRTGARMSRLVGDLVDVASIEAGALAVRREPSDPAQVVIEAVDTFQAQAAACEISLVAETVAPLPRTQLDPARILQVLTNLLSNALKFTSAGGSVVMRVERVADELCFSVSDTGIGIPADKLEAVFDRFLQVNANDPRGVGLGLYISKCIIQGHEGRIWAESKLGEGSRIRFALPVHGAP